MSTACNVCHSALAQPIYQSPENHSITTMNTLVEGRTLVYFCAACGHLQTNELPDLAAYYASEYSINANSEDDDQIYKVVGGQTIFRADHQAAVLQTKVHFSPGCRVLDYGCAKAPTLRKLLGVCPGIEPYLFDLTDKYQPFWQRFPTPARTAVGVPDAAWDGELDVVLSFYALEHVSDLTAAIGTIRRLLKVGGTFYFIVPNAYQNVADFVVADHINHFSDTSLRTLLERNGFDQVAVDAQAHDGAFVVSARHTGRAVDAAPLPAQQTLAALEENAQAMSRYWRDIVGKIRAFEASLPGDAAVAIYGAGFYANFIALSLQDVGRVTAFVDQNPHLQGTTLYQRPVLAPAALPAAVTHLLVGLNPRIARANIEAIAPWQGRQLACLYL
jgi:SAM-dependent methyltransferase